MLNNDALRDFQNGMYKTEKMLCELETTKFSLRMIEELIDAKNRKQISNKECVQRINDVLEMRGKNEKL